MKEIEVPKNLRQFMLEGAEETNLGDKKGARKQFRYGNLHIREYDDRFTVHSDKIDPRKNPLGHLLIDAPEILVGLAGAAIGGLAIGAYIYKMKKDPPAKTPQSIISGLAASLATGYASYIISKKLKE